MSDASLSEVLNQFFNNKVAELRVATPAQIVSYDYKTQLATVQPVISRRYDDERVEPFKPINNVPIVFPRSGGASLTFPVKAGDPVLLVFSDRSLDTWKQSGGVQPQDDIRKHSINDAIGFVGISAMTHPSQAENNDDVLLDFDGNKLRMKPSGNAEVVSDQSIVLRVGTSTITMTPNHIHVRADRIDWN